jgi:uncharacterized protein YjiS (DUF1127 family)
MLLRLKKIWHRFEAYQQKRADEFILKSMSDRELRDMGLPRGSIREAIYGTNKTGQSDT